MLSLTVSDIPWCPSVPKDIRIEQTKANTSKRNSENEEVVINVEKGSSAGKETTRCRTFCQRIGKSCRDYLFDDLALQADLYGKIGTSVIAGSLFAQTQKLPYTQQIAGLGAALNLIAGIHRIGPDLGDSSARAGCKCEGAFTSSKKAR